MVQLHIYIYDKCIIIIFIKYAQGKPRKCAVAPFTFCFVFVLFCFHLIFIYFYKFTENNLKFQLVMLPKICIQTFNLTYNAPPPRTHACPHIQGNYEFMSPAFAQLPFSFNFICLLKFNANKLKTESSQLHCYKHFVFKHLLLHAPPPSHTPLNTRCL